MVFRDGIAHDCQGPMRYCGTHPRWQVISLTRGYWHVYEPKSIKPVWTGATQPEAYAEARRLATKEEA